MVSFTLFFKCRYFLKYDICQIIKVPFRGWGQSMITTTTPDIQGRKIEQYFGVISSEVIIGANIFKDILGGLRDILGGRSGTYERVMEDAKNQALKELETKALRLGANAIVGIDLDFETIGSSGSMLMVSASGTAVRIN